MHKKSKIAIIAIIILIVIASIISFLYLNQDTSELKTIKSKSELSKIYEGDTSTFRDTLINIFTMPFSMMAGNWYYGGYIGNGYLSSVTNEANSSYSSNLKGDATSSENTSSSSTKDYSTTNIQVENVDEADITKTDGDYIYSISEDNVIITNVTNPQDIKIESTIKTTDGSIPEDLMIYKDKLIIILTDSKYSMSSYYYSSSNNTIVKIYDISEKNNPTLLKSYELFEPYYTSRSINNKLYVISSGNLRKNDDDEIDTYYEEDNEVKEINLNSIKYLKDVKNNKQTLISVVNLDDVNKDVEISSYLIDISNAYVSEKAIYLLDEEYKYSSYAPPVSSLYGWQGAIGPFVYEENNKDNGDYGTYTNIYKFEISTDGYVSYDAKTEIKGKTINQYSLDEKQGHLRIALYDYNGTRVAIFDENLKQIGTSEYVAKGETMYSSRFMDNKVYLVTYKTVDPLFVIDLNNEQKPKVLGKLKIPGYSTYLHPYDENHLIGIGMETEEVVNRNSSGRVISTTSQIIGMKMALFDVSNVNNPIQISSTVIGDRRTTSAILTNPKALLFSKEKELIAIPVNNYQEDFQVISSDDDYASIINSYTKKCTSYISEGYFVYNINIEDGFNLKGVITHEKSKYNTNSKLLRGLYIDDNLYTVSEKAIKVNDLNNLNLISELEIK